MIYTKLMKGYLDMGTILFLLLLIILPGWSFYFLFTLIRYKICNPADAQEFLERWKDMKTALIGFLILIAAMGLILLLFGGDLAEM